MRKVRIRYYKDIVPSYPELTIEELDKLIKEEEKCKDLTEWPAIEQQRKSKKWKIAGLKIWTECTEDKKQFVQIVAAQILFVISMHLILVWVLEILFAKLAEVVCM